MTDEIDSLLVEHMKALRNPLREFALRSRAL